MCEPVSIALALSAASAVAAGGTAIMSNIAAQEQADAQDKQAEAQKRAEELRQQQIDLKMQQERMATIRQARIVQANAIASGEAKGGEGSTSSSSTVSGPAGITSRLSGNLSYLDQSQALGDQASASVGQAYDFASEARGYALEASTIRSYGGAIGNVFDVAAKNSGAIKGLFNKPDNTDLVYP